MDRYKQKLILVLLISVTYITRAYACSCQSGGSISEGVNWAKVVFSGTVLSETISEIDSRHKLLVYKVKIDRLFKGKVKSDIIDIWTQTAGTACGIKFKSKEKILVYATDAAFYLDQKHYVENLSFYTNVCTRSAGYLLSEERGIRQALGKEVKPIRR